MFTDMVGFSGLVDQNEPQALELLGIQSELLEPLLVVHGGRLIRTMGDGAFVEFSSALGACRAGLDIQEAITKHNKQAPEGRRFKIRIGIHLGDVEAVGDDLFGHGVNVAARLEPLAEPGGICISEDVARQVRGKLSAELASLGQQRLKGIAEPIQAYRLVPAAPTAGHRPTPKEPSVAVLPFANLSGDPDNEYFGDGLTDEILSALSKVRTLRVVSRTSCYALKGSTKSLRELGSILSVDCMLEGSVRRAGNRVRVSVQLVDIASDRPLWSERFDRELEDIFEIQEEITRNIVDSLQIALSEVERGLIGGVPTHNLAAYRNYVLAQTGLTDISRALKQLQEAIALDPNFAKAHALASTMCMHSYRFLTEELDFLGMARDYAEKSLALEPNLVEGYGALADVALAEGDVKRADELFEHALQLDPRDFWCLYTYARSHRQRGNSARAAELFARAAQVRPDDYDCYSLSVDLYDELGDPESAANVALEALARIERRLACCSTDHRALYLGANVLGRLGDKQRARSWADQALALAPQDTGVLYNLACFFCVQGDRDKALDLLERAYESGFSLADWVRNDPELSSLREEPKFKAILIKMEARHA